MSAQLSLLDYAPPCAGLDREFQEWVASNPHIVSAFCARALAHRRTGREHYGAKRIVEELRFDTALTQAAGAWKIDNSMVSRLARLAMDQSSELIGFFETRKLAG